MRGALLPIEISSSDLGNGDSIAGTTHTFSSVAVGSGGGRTIIVMATCEDFDAPTGTLEINSVTIDGTSSVQQVHIAQFGGTDFCAAIFSLDLTTETGNVDIVVGTSNSSDSAGMSFVILTGVQSSTATDTATGSVDPSTTLPSSTTLDGEIDGFAVGIATMINISSTFSWGSSLTERVDVATGGAGVDHRHGGAYDLLPTGRSASTETVTLSSSREAVLAVATFR